MSTLSVSNISDGTDTVETGYVVNGSAKASCRYNQVTNSILSSDNVSSISDDSTGEYTVTFTAAFTGADTQRVSGTIITGTGKVLTVTTGVTGGSLIAFRTTGSNATTDADQTSTAAVHGDLA